MGPLAALSLRRFYFSKDRHLDGSMSLGGVDAAHIQPGATPTWFQIPPGDNRWGIKMEDIYVRASAGS